MARISSKTIDAILERGSLIEVVGDYTTLSKSGANYKGLCPFHNEKTPSFFVNGEKGVFKCFGCGESGNIFHFVSRREGIDFPEAVAVLAKRFHIPVEYQDGVKEQNRGESLLALNDFAARFYQGALSSTSESYLKHRGLNDATIQSAGIGEALKSSNALVVALKRKGIALADAEKIGLIIKGKYGYYDRFRERVMFPIQSVSGAIVGFGGRTRNDHPIKYMNSPESEIYQKSKVLYGLNWAKAAIREQGEVIVVEGYFDQLLMMQFGFRNTVAICGTSLTQSHLNTLKRYASNVVLVLDPDLAGIKASIRAMRPLFQEGMNGYVCVVPEGHDPASYLCEGGRPAFESCLAQKIPILRFFVAHHMKADSGLSAKMKVADTLIDIIAKVDQPVAREILLKEVAHELSLTESAVTAQFERRIHRRGQPKEIRYVNETRSQERPSARFSKAEAFLASVLLQWPHVVSDSNVVQCLDCIEDDGLRELLLDLKRSYPTAREQGVLVQSLMLRHEGLASVISEWIMSPLEMDANTLQRAISDCVAKIRNRREETRRKRLLARIVAAEKNKDTNLVAALMAEKQKSLQETREKDPL